MTFHTVQNAQMAAMNTQLDALDQHDAARTRNKSIGALGVCEGG
jgi:hypothetical protein